MDRVYLTLDDVLWIHEDQLRRYLQTDVSLNVHAGMKGEIRIQFYSNEDLERILELLLDSPNELP